MGDDDDVKDNAGKFAKWLGCVTPNNNNRHPARSGTLIYGEERLLKAEVGSFMDANLASLTSSLVPPAGMSAEKSDLTKPPKMAMFGRGRVKPVVNPDEFKPEAMNAWTQAKNWSAPTIGKTRPKRKATPAKATPQEVIQLDNGTDSTTSMSSQTQAAMDEMRRAIQRLENDKKSNDNKVASLDTTLAQLAKEVTTIEEAQRKTSNDFVQIKEQIVNIAQTNTELRKEMDYIGKNMTEMSDMLKILTGRAVLSSLSAAATKGADTAATSDTAAPITQATTQDEHMT